MYRGVSKRKFGGTKKSVAAAKALRRAAAVFRERNPSIIGTPYGTPFGVRTGGGSELKFIDTLLANSPIPAAGALTLVNGVAQGTDFTNRIGRKTVIKSLLFNASVVYNAAGSLPIGDICRLMVVWDSQANSAAPAVTDILATADPYSGMNLNNRDRFQIIWDKRFAMNPATYAAGALTAGAPNTKWITKYKRCHKECIFSNTGATIASIQTGSIYFLQISQNTANCSTNMYIRIRFVDS